MKKLVLALILALILTMIFSIPVLADDGNGPGNMPGVAASFPMTDWKGLTGAIRRIGQGAGYGNSPISWAGTGVYVSTNHAISNIMNGDPPGKPWWASTP